ncbi:MAG: redoxin domain-containing protein [Ethanoligenens sp.]
MDTMTMPQIGEKAPEFQAQSTRGIIRFPRDFKGKWIILLSHPGAFNPVCASEFQALASMQQKFSEKNCALLSFSPDSSEAHAAWIKELEKSAPGGAAAFAGIPLVADDGGVIAKRYGVLPQGAARPVRGVFIIDPQATIRVVLLYPRGIGRSTAEIFRLLLALQAVEDSGVSVPANWKPTTENETPSVPYTGLETTQQPTERRDIQQPKGSAVLPMQTAEKTDSDWAQAAQAEPQVRSNTQTQPAYDVTNQPAPIDSSNSKPVQETNKPAAAPLAGSHQQPLRPVSQSVWDALAEAQPQVSAPEQPTYPAASDTVPPISSFVHMPPQAKPDTKPQPTVKAKAAVRQHGNTSGLRKTSGSSIADQNRRLLGDLLDKEDAEDGNGSGSGEYFMMRDFPYKQ